MMGGVQPRPPAILDEGVITNKGVAAALGAVHLGRHPVLLAGPHDGAHAALARAGGASEPFRLPTIARGPLGSQLPAGDARDVSTQREI